MASWLPETLFEIVGQGRAPSKDYYQLVVTRSQVLRKIQNALMECGAWHVPLLLCEELYLLSRAMILLNDVTGECLWQEVIFRWWKISLRSEYRSTKPGEVKETHEDFLENANLQVQVALIFGGRILDYISNLCRGNFDYLERLSDTLLLNIISYLDLEDIASLSQTSRRFAKLCMSDTLWEQIVRLACDNITSDMRALATDIGWRQIFFTNKLQLQRQLRRRKQIRKPAGEAVI